MADLYTSVPRPFAGTAQINYKNSYKRRLMDRSIMTDITNSNFKGDVGRGKGTTVRVYVPGVVQVRDTRPDGSIIYQQVTDTWEDYTIGREAYWALKFRPEDKAFAPFDIKSPYFTNAADQMARHIERKFGMDIITKVPAYNRGNTAGVKFHGFDLGGVGDGNAVTLYKTQTQCDAATGVQHRDVAADFIVKIANTIKENEGLSEEKVTVIIPSVVKHHLQTSELKYGGLMGQRNLDLRGDVKFLGTMDDTIDVIQDNIMLPVFKNTTNNRNVYPILALTKEAVTYFDDIVFRDDALKDVGDWDEHYRSKQVFDWALVWPQMLALGYVELAEPTYIEP